jgi:hypothetical protein
MTEIIARTISDGCDLDHSRGAKIFSCRSNMAICGQNVYLGVSYYYFSPMRSTFVSACQPA